MKKSNMSTCLLEPAEYLLFFFFLNANMQLVEAESDLELLGMEGTYGEQN